MREPRGRVRQAGMDTLMGEFRPGESLGLADIGT